MLHFLLGLDQPKLDKKGGSGSRCNTAKRSYNYLVILMSRLIY